jgi:hypothetical protein
MGLMGNGLEKGDNGQEKTVRIIVDMYVCC